jgi:hypothetical protein
MTFDNPEVVELGLAEELIQDDFHLTSSEGSMPQRIRTGTTVYAADAE